RDCGPSDSELFRNYREHKMAQLRELISDYTRLMSILICEDFQHDPLMCSEGIKYHPTQLINVQGRTLSPRVQGVSHGTLAPLSEVAKNARATVPIIHGQNGHVLIEEFEAKPFGAKPFEV